MMTVVYGEEEYFPRGGNSTSKKTSINPARTYVFQPRKNVKAAIKKPGRRERLRENKKKIILENQQDSEDEFSAIENGVEHGLLSFKSLRDGTLTMCSIMEVFPKYILVSLPGRLCAQIPINLTSHPIKTLLKAGSIQISLLKKYFPQGYSLPCRVINVKLDKNKWRATVSTDPNLVYSHLTFNLISVGFISVAAVQSVEDHGYIMMTGIKGVNAFLPFSKCNSLAKSLDIGQLVWCTVTKSKLSNTCNVVELSANPDEISSAKLGRISTSDILIPGVQVDVSIKKVLPNLLLVKVLKSDEKGYIPNSQLDYVWTKANDYKVGTKRLVTVLYKFPHVDSVCFSLFVKANSIRLPEIDKGMLFQRAEIMQKDKRAITVRLEHNNEFYKGLLSIKNLQKNINDAESIDDSFTMGNHITVRVVHYHSIDRVYSCTNLDDKLKKGGSITDFKVGEVVQIKITRISEKGLTGIAKQCKVCVPLHQINSNLKNPTESIKINEEYTGRILTKQENCNALLATLHPKLVHNKPLVNFELVNIGEEYFGAVYRVKLHGVVLRFFNDLTVYISETHLTKRPNNFKIGELVKCYVINKACGTRPPFLTANKPLDKMELKIGYPYAIIVKSITEKGLHCIVLENKKPLKCILPVSHLCDSLKFCPLLLNNFKVGKTIEDAILYSYDGNQNPIFSLRHSVKKFFEDNPLIKQNGFFGLKRNDILPATIFSFNEKTMTLYIPVAGYNGKVFTSTPPKVYRLLQINQGIPIKIENKLTRAGILKVICNIQSEIPFFIYELTQYFIEISKYIARDPGELLKVKITSIDKNENVAQVKLPDSSSGKLLLLNNKKKLKINNEIQAIFLYKDVFKKEIYLIAKEQLQDETENSFNIENENSQMKIVRIGEDFCVGIVIESTEVIILNPINARLVQSWEESKGYPLLSSNISKPDCIKECGKFKLGIVHWTDIIKMKNLNKSDEVSMSMDIVESCDNSNADEEEVEVGKVKEKKRKSIGENDDTFEPSKKRKIENLKKTTIDNDKLLQNIKEKKVLEKSIDKMKIVNKNKNVKLNDSISDEARLLRWKKWNEVENITFESVGGFDWDATPTDFAKINAQGKIENLSEDSDEEVVIKKKLTPAERKAAQIESERIVREMEEDMLKSEKNPQSSDHFERLLLATPNNSKLWIQYMAFHLQGTDIEKARSVARRGINQINVREEQDRLNLWIALLNLENLYGTSETFEKTLSEALKYSDDYKVYIKVLGMHSESQRLVELDKLTNHLVRKFKEKSECWLECLSALMSVGLTDKARNFLQRSLKSLPKKEHINLISRFALLENKHGFHEQAHSLFENLLTSYPQRIDLWNVYVDMLVKSGSVDLARNVLERIPSHQLPFRKMKAIYRKWLNFEEKYGTEKTVENVRKSAKGYIKDILGEMDDETSKRKVVVKKKNVDVEGSDNEEEMEQSAGDDDDEEENQNNGGSNEVESSDESDDLSDDDD